MLAFGPLVDIWDGSIALFLSNLADRLGFDANEAGWVLGLAIECYEKGLITSKDTDGLELTWGNYKAVHQMMERIARREGFGHILAEGAMRAAQRIGGEAPNYAVHTMGGTTTRGVQFKQIWPYIMDHCLGQGGTNEGMEYILRPGDVGITISQPEGIRVMPGNLSADDTVDWNVKVGWGAHFNDSLGVCWFPTNGDFKRLLEALRSSTGWDFPAEECVQAGKRIQNLLRAFNVRCRRTPGMDAPSPRMVSAIDGPIVGEDIMLRWNELRSKVYEGLGWDKKTGRPLPDTLRKLGLEHTIPELWGSD
jgi:aldehyde:ferredoxin oxidoreductase